MDNEATIQQPVPDNSPEIIVLKFADSAVPVFKENRDRNYIKYGNDNKYPEYLTYLYNKSAKHNAILTGKANYIFGNGFENGNLIVNRSSDSLNDVSRKCILDNTIYGGYRLEIIWDFTGKVSEIYHCEWSNIRKAKDGGFWFKECWDIGNRDEPEYIPAFNPKERVGSQIFEYIEYRPGIRFYPLPDYIGSNNYIETDIEISKFHLSAIRNGMAPSKMIQFFTGEPTEEGKKKIERRLTEKFTGAEKAGRMFLVFNKTNDSKAVQVDDLSASELDKQFDLLNKTCQQEIFSGHLVTSPMLFGIMEPGKLGGATELKTAYEIFINTYAKPKAEAFDREINWLLSFSKWPGEYELERTDPIGWQVPDGLLEQAITPDEIREKLGLPVIAKTDDNQATRQLAAIQGVSPLVANKILESLTPNEIRALVSFPPNAEGNGLSIPAATSPSVDGATLDSDAPVNSAITNLTAKQHQQVTRIIRQYAKGQLTELAAKTLLRAGYGLGESDINDLLGIAPTAPLAMGFSNPDEIIGMFDACGDARSDYEVLKTKRVMFSSLEEIEEDEQVYKAAFIKYDVTDSERTIIEMYRENESVSVREISDRTSLTENYINSKIEALLRRGYIERTDGGLIHVPPSIDTLVKEATETPTQIFIKYSYEGPQDSRNRPFCARMMQLDRFYSRAEIEQISARLGYSVFDRRGGFWTEKGTSITHPYCRHFWRSSIVVKKGGKNVN